MRRKDNLNRQYLRKNSIENYSGGRIKYKKVRVLKKHQYYIVPGYTITGDAPKDFIRVYEYGVAKKTQYKQWPLYIAKTGHKWYPLESITELLLNKLGEAFGLEMAESAVVLAGDQIRFLSKYFLKDDEELSHGAEIFAGYLNDKEFVEKVETENLARDFFTLQFTQKSLKFAFPYYYEYLLNSFVKMLLFDALVGNNDRHFYNWGIVRHIGRAYKPFFAPVYDTARGLFWNEPEQKILSIFRNKNRLNQYIKKYSNNSRPKIGWDNEKNINHFKLVAKIYENKFGITQPEIKSLFLRSGFEKLVRIVHEDFTGLMSRERIEIIAMCLEYRYKKILQIIEEKRYD